MLSAVEALQETHRGERGERLEGRDLSIRI
jgi:hypothetical protein